MSGVIKEPSFNTKPFERRTEFLDSNESNQFLPLPSDKDLADIKYYWESVLEVSPDDFMAEIYHKAKKLEDFPFAHHQPSDPTLKAKGYRICPVRNYYIFYVN